jgi:predicted nucleic acid-binding protein
MNVVMDTDVWSFVFKGDTRAQRYLPYLADKTVCVSFQTVAELYQWAEIRLVTNNQDDFVRIEGLTIITR